MTCKPAVKLSFVFPVAADAKPHLEFHTLQTIHGLHVPMASAAIKLSPDVPLMVKLNVIRQIKDPHPLHGLPGIQMFPLIHDLRMMGNNVLVAEKTFTHLR